MSMLGEAPFAYEPLAASTPTGKNPLGSGGAFFDVLVTVLSQYANSPVLLKLIAYFSEWLDPASRFDAFYREIWDITVARGHGLDVWGRILGVTRILEVPSGVYLGFVQDEEARPFGHGIFYQGGRSTNSAVLTDEAYRLLLLAKAALNITDAASPSINRILLALFGMGYVRDNLDMTITYVFSRPLEPVERAIVFQSGAIPKPIGVSFTVEEA